MRVEALYLSPVKSLALNRVDRAWLGKSGFTGDRSFFLIDADGRLFTQRDHFPLVQVHAGYDVAGEHLRLAFPDGSTVEGPADVVSAPLRVPFWSRREVEGRVVDGLFAEALSSFAGRPLRLVRVASGGAFDGVPVSICSMESVRQLAQVAGTEHVDERRFRQNIWISGVGAPHEEDAWIGHTVRVGEATLRPLLRDARCVVTTRSPATGEHDLNTLKLIASYRTDQPGAVNFGVYAGVESPGEIAVGDAVVPMIAAVEAGP